MKNVMLGTSAFLMFLIALVLFQISSQETAAAQTPAAPQQGKMLLLNGFCNCGGTAKLWIINLDGTNRRQVPMPQVPGIQWTNADISPDGRTIFVSGYVSVSNNQPVVYSMASDGTNVKKVVEHKDFKQGLYTVQAY